MGLRHLSAAFSAESGTNVYRSARASRGRRRIRAGAVLLVAVLVMSNCSDDTTVGADVASATSAVLSTDPGGPSPATDASTAVPSTAPSTTNPPAASIPASTTIAPITTAPGPLDPDDPYGPMAVYSGADGRLASAGTGTLEITDDCVLFHTHAWALQLVWGDLQAQWVPDERAIYFDNQVEPPLLLRSGDRISVGGAGLLSVDPVTGETVDPDTGERGKWGGLSELGDACEFDYLWSVSLVRRQP